MAKEKKGGLSAVFNNPIVRFGSKLALFGLGTAFGFYVMGPFDFEMFHNMAEGELLLDRWGPVVQDYLRADIPFLGFSVADSMVAIAEMAPTPDVEVVAQMEEQIFESAAPAFEGFG